MFINTFFLLAENTILIVFGLKQENFVAFFQAIPSSKRFLKPHQITLSEWKRIQQNLKQFQNFFLQ